MTTADIRRTLKDATRIAVLTGAGISAASGVPTFRGDDGLWRNFRAQDLATPDAYRQNPQLVWEWYQMRFNAVMNVQPNAAHLALANLEKGCEDFTLITQNVDGLHQRAGSDNVFELHGNLTQARCEACGEVVVLEAHFPLPPPCPACRAPMRPNVVWFGEMLPEHAFEAGVDAFNRAEVALIIGTSAVVEPAASLGRIAAQAGAFVIEINPDRTPLTMFADVTLRMDAVTGMAQLLG